MLNVFEYVVEANGDVEAFGEAGCEIYIHLSRPLDEVEVISKNRIRSLI